ncbi:phage tail assembly protein [Yersinia kristensenii]|uniref:phage tail assembly protein n=1 Tax=Yersinia kristensenii TaxID=28152 RepID=UPI0005E1D44D|nr:phage tail assembly protein [Yersinia kristensenii]MDA5473253.1 phage tail assembly protein [Yersinia kristensenii]MDA5475635.1 phage tail assembly protein [Yersinia kristensenii]MDA5507069.1 phage tail assembly protein [Yersinia kristensenii]MDA5523353.1 phage tail assembly protein [Yersinia kristensenii]NIK96074.1 phage tail assembly protein [Yersinia kristensenii]
MAELERTKTIPLVKPISHEATKTTYEVIELSEPVLIQVQQFYDEQTKSGSLSAMGLLISLVSGVPREAIKKMAFTDYKACEVYMMSFLAYSPQPESGATN